VTLTTKEKVVPTTRILSKNTDYQTPNLTPLSEVMIREKSPISPLETRSGLLP